MAAIQTRIVILGGGFGGLYAAMRLEKFVARHPDVDVVLVNRDNFFLYTPMLHEVAASDLDPTNIVNPVHKLLRKVRFFCGDVDAIDLRNKTVVVSHGASHHSHDLPYDHLVLSLGSVTNFYGLPGLEAHCRTMKTLDDAINLRNHTISLLEEADFECCKHLRDQLLTFVVAGGGFAGVETIAGLCDFVHDAVKCYPNLNEKQLRFVLVNSGDVILPELDKKLGEYAQKILRARKIEIFCNTKVKRAWEGGCELTDGTQITSSTMVWTAGTTPNPLISTLPCQKEKGRLSVNEFFEVPEYPGVWALGDCACVPDKLTGTSHPPTAQHALREGKVLADNIIASISGARKKPFRFSTLGQLAAIGRRTGVAQILGFRFSGFIAWAMWRTIYLMKLPRLEKKVRVALDWTLDLLFSKDTVQYLTYRKHSISTTEEPKFVPQHVSNDARRLEVQVQ